MLVPSRHGSSESYRYGFNGKEKDDELKGDGNGIDYDKRFYDTRLGRFLSIDPLEKKFPWYTPYQFAGNTPIQAIDLDGAEEFHYTLIADKKGKIHLTLTSYKTHNHVTLLWGLIDRYYKIPVKRYVVTHNNTKYYIGFAGTYGNGNQDKSEMFENIRDAQHMWTLSDFKDSFNSEAQSNYQSTVQTVINIQNNTVMYGPIKETAWYTPKDRKNKGYGPDPGVIEVSPRVKSVALFKKYNPKNATEFVFDAETQTFVVGKVQNSTLGLSPHQNLAKSIDNNNVVGGLFKRGENGEIITNEMSGHYHQNWTPEIRQKFKTFLENKTGQTVKHSEGPTF